MSKTPQKNFFICFKLETLYPWFLSEPTRSQTPNSLHPMWKLKFFRGHKRFTRISQLSFNLQIGHIEHIIFIEARQIPP